MRKVLNRHLASRQLAAKKEREERQELERLDERMASLEEAQKIAQAVAQRIQTQAHARIAEIVTQCLEIFDDTVEFKITFERRRGKTEAKLSFVSEGVEVEEPLNGSGLGVVDVAAFALRVSCLILSQPPLRRLLIMDEPFRHLSPEYRPKVRVLLERLSEELGIQMVMATHSAALRSGKIIELE